MLRYTRFVLPFKLSYYSSALISIYTFFNQNNAHEGDNRNDDKGLFITQRGVLILEKNSLSTNALEKKVDRLAKMIESMKTNNKVLAT